MAEEVKDKKTEVKESKPRTPRANSQKKPAPRAEKPQQAEKLDVKPVRRAKGKKQTANSYIATGRRKDAIARVRLVSGSGKITINDRDIDEYLKLDTLKLVVRQPLVLTGTDKKYDVIANVKGGGYTGQTGAIRHGISRALVKENEMYKAELKKAGFLSRDSRMKERKKYGLHKARKAPQFSKR